MSKVSIKGNASGTGNFSIEAPNSNVDRTLALPDEAGTVLTSGGPIDVNDSAPADSVAIDSSGNVGIGTSNPSTLLSLENSAPILSATSTNGASGFRVFVSGAAGDTFRVFNEDQSSNQLIVRGNGDLRFNSGYGSAATAYGCRAWVNFNGTGTVSIRESGNVSSITDNGTGSYYVNFGNAMPDALGIGVTDGSDGPGAFNRAATSAFNGNTRTQITSFNTGSNNKADLTHILHSVFR